MTICLSVCLCHSFNVLHCVVLCWIFTSDCYMYECWVLLLVLVVRYHYNRINYYKTITALLKTTTQIISRWTPIKTSTAPEEHKKGNTCTYILWRNVKITGILSLQCWFYDDKITLFFVLFWKCMTPQMLPYFDSISHLLKYL